MDINHNTLAVFARANYVHNVGWNDLWSAPASVDYNQVANGVMYRNSKIRIAAVTDGLSNTVFVGERTPYLSDATGSGVNAEAWPLHGLPSSAAVVLPANGIVIFARP